MPICCSPLHPRWALGLVWLLLAGAAAAQAPASYTRAAEFTVTDQVINADLQPFTASIGGFGNSLIHGGSFEPAVFRNRYTAVADAQDRIWLSRTAATHWDSLAEGALDGAEVRVYRIENGRFQLVRQDQVAAGGAAASGWTPVHSEQQLVPAGTPAFVFKWDNFNRPGVPYYFSVSAVDAQGRESDMAAAVAVVRPSEIRDAQPTNALVPFSPSRLPGLPLQVSAPEGLQALLQPDGTVALSWQANTASRAVGYRVYRSDHPPDRHRGYFFDLQGRAKNSAEGIRRGDFVIVSKKFFSRADQGFHTHRVWGAKSETGLLTLQGLYHLPHEQDSRVSWELALHNSDTPVTQPGETYLRLEVPTTQPIRLSYYNHSGTDQHWYPVLREEPYRVEVWLRRTSGIGNVRFRLAGFYDNPARRIPVITFTPGAEWRKYTAVFTPSEVQRGRAANDMVLEFLGPGEFEVDNFRVYRAGTPFMDFDAHEYAELQASGMGFLRTHAFIKTGRRSYDLSQLTAPAGVTSSAARHNTLPQTLHAIRRAGMQPWLQIEPHFSPAEWLGLVEYLAAPYDPAVDTPTTKPWAFRRYQQGQAQPWTNEFQRWKFEIGNETWNNLFAPWVFEDMTDAATGQRYSRGAVYGLFQEYVVGIMRASPYWLAPNWTANSSSCWVAGMVSTMAVMLPALPPIRTS